MSKEDDLIEKVQLLTDSYAKSILVGCYQKPMSAQEISWEYNIPIAATYRRLKDLEEAGLIEEVVEETTDTSTSTSNSNNSSRYKTSLEKAVLTFEDGTFSIKLKVGEEEIDSEL